MSGPTNVFDEVTLFSDDSTQHHVSRMKTECILFHLHSNAVKLVHHLLQCQPVVHLWATNRYTATTTLAHSLWCFFTACLSFAPATSGFNCRSTASPTRRTRTTSSRRNRPTRYLVCQFIQRLNNGVSSCFVIDIDGTGLHSFLSHLSHGFFGSGFLLVFFAAFVCSLLYVVQYLVGIFVAFRFSCTSIQCSSWVIDRSRFTLHVALCCFHLANHRSNCVHISLSRGTHFLNSSIELPHGFCHTLCGRLIHLRGINSALKRTHQLIEFFIGGGNVDRLACGIGAAWSSTIRFGRTRLCGHQGLNQTLYVRRVSLN